MIDLKSTVQRNEPATDWRGSVSNTVEEPGGMMVIV